MGRHAEKAVPELRRMLTAPGHRLVHYAILETLEQIGPAAKGATPEILGRLSDPDENVRRSAIRALGKVSPPAELAVPALVAILQDSNAKAYHLDAIESLGAIGPAAKAALLALTAVEQEGDLSLRDAAATALRRIKTDP
jgi:HEAT repeat protein